MEKDEKKVVRIGPLLTEVLNKQKEQMKEACYDCIDPSDYEAGEIIAKKFLKLA
jgi:hypothetical protein